MVKVVILKEKDYDELKMSVISALYFLENQDKFPENYAKSELRRHLHEASAILDKEDGDE